MEHYLFLVNIAFIVSTFIDILIIGALFFLFYKIYKTRIITTQNNMELHTQHDKIDNIQEEVLEIKHHE